MAILWVLVGAAIVVAISIFHAYNPQMFNISLYGYPIAGVPMWALVAVPAFIGLFIGILMDLPDRVRAAFHERRLGNSVRERDKTIADLQHRVTELERDLALARRPDRPEPPVVIEETREAPAGSFSANRTELHRAA
jgi:hypothetical protein